MLTSIGDAVEKASHDDHVVYTHTAWNDQYKRIVQKIQALHQQIVRNGSCIEEHCDRYKNVDNGTSS